MTPRLIAFYEGQEYARMARVLAYTAARFCPDWDRQIVNTVICEADAQGDELRRRLNNSKLLKWTETVEQAPDGTPMLLVDSDVMIVRSLDDIWQQSFDVAYTVRDPQRSTIPLNGGVVFVRANDASRRFLRAWYQATIPYKTSAKKWQEARKKYGACDQAGLCQLLKQPSVGVQILALPCQEWNCEDSEWGRFDVTTRIVHIKGSLRSAVFGDWQRVSAKRKPQVVPLAKQWKAFEARL